MKNVLTIAGSDSCGGAGIQADLKTFSAHKVYGMSVITAITAQNTQGVFDAIDIDSGLIKKQIEVLFDDIKIDAVKIGMVSSIESIKSIAKMLKKYNPHNVVLDTVMISKSGFALLKEDAITTLIEELIPLATVITPNLHEATAILKRDITTLQEMESAAKELHTLGCKYVLVKGGHLIDDAIDVLFDGKKIYHLKSERIETKNTHGTGCTLSASIASNLALGYEIYSAIQKSKEYITGAIKNSLEIGKGVGPTHHFFQYY